MYFFKGLDAPQSEDGEDTVTKRESIQLVHAYYRIKSGKVRKLFFKLVKSAAEAGD